MSVSNIVGVSASALSHIVGKVKSAISHINNQTLVPPIFEDDFNDNSINVAKWLAANSADVTVSEQSAAIRFAMDASYSGSANMATLTSVPTFNATGKNVEIAAPSYINIGGNTWGFRLINTLTNGYVSFHIGTTNYVAELVNTSGTAVSNGITHNATYTRWRIRHSTTGNPWRFDTYTSGAWTERTSLSFTSGNPWSPTAVKVVLFLRVANTGLQSQNVTIADITSDLT